MKKLIVFLGSALISLWPSVRNFNLRVKKKLIEGPEFFYFSLVIHHITVRSDIGFRPTPLRDYEQQKQRQ